MGRRPGTKHRARESLIACVRGSGDAIALVIVAGCAGACATSTTQPARTASAAATSRDAPTPQEPRHLLPGTGAPAPAPLTTQSAVAFADSSHGWLVASRCSTACVLEVATTLDGGTSWGGPVTVATDAELSRASAGPPTLLFSLGVRFVGDDGWIFGPGVFQTHNGGRSWKRTLDGAIPVLEPYGRSVWALQECGLADSSVPCVPVLMQATIGSDVWSRATPQPPLEGALGAPSLFLERDPRGVAFIAEDGVPTQVRPDGTDTSAQRLFTSWDTGSSWRTLPPPCDDIRAIRSLDGVRVWTLCATPCCTGNWVKAVYVSADGGQTWAERADTGYQGQHGSMDFYGSAGAFSVPAPGDALYGSSGSAGIWRSSDGGQTWHSTFADICIEGGNAVTQLWFVTRLRGWAVAGDTSDASCPALVRTSDGGESWAPLVSPFS
jgi:photosystem II stability/assembly factor-like uncharacterized protein